MMGNFENYLLVGDILFSVYNIGSRLLNKKEDNPQESSFSPPPPLLRCTGITYRTVEENLALFPPGFFPLSPEGRQTL